MLTITLTAPAWLPFLAFIVAIKLEAFFSRKAAVTVAWVGLAVSAVVALVGSNLPRLPLLTGAIVAGGGVSLLAAVMLTCAAVAVLAGTPRMASSPTGARTAALMAAAAAAAVVVIGARDLLLLVVALETMALAGYALVALGSSRRAAVASTTYFVQGAIAAGFLLFGVGALTVIMGQTRYGFDSGARLPFQLVTTFGAFPTASAALTAMGLTATALVFKAGGFPLHSWVPDAYESADAAPAAFLASVPKTAALVALAVLAASLGFSTPGTPFGLIAAFVAAASVAFGTFAGLKQTDYRRMLGYSSIAQAGFALMGLVVGGPRGVVLVALMASVYALATIGAFAAAEAWRWVQPGWDGSIAGMRGLGTARPLLGVALATVLFSLTGIPPLAGFWGKLTVFAAAIGTGRYLWLAIVGALASVVSFGYYGRVLRAVWLDPSPEPPADDTRSADATAPGGPRPRSMEEQWSTAAVVVSALAVLAVGLAPLIWGSAVLSLFGR
jgi:NADH-quinone oxidoreductase subunit N